MNFFSILTLLGGLAMFLYGMQVMGDGLAKVSGGKLEQILENLTSSKWKAVLLGMCVTAVIQSSSGNNRYGRWFCKFWYHETNTGGRNHYGCQYWYYDYILDLESDRN